MDLATEISEKLGILHLLKISHLFEKSFYRDFFTGVFKPSVKSSNAVT